MVQRRRFAAPGVGHNMVFAGGMVIFSMMVSSVAVDLPLYFATQNQLQTAVDSAALAGAAKLPEGGDEAEEAAKEYGKQNKVAGKELADEEFEFIYDDDANTFQVNAQTTVPTVFSKLVCALQGYSMQAPEGGLEGGGQDGSEVGGEQEQNAAPSSCSFMTIAAHAKAVPAARDTVLVLDTSSSMDDLGNGQPLKDVKKAAKAYVDRVLELDSESIDRIAVVSFDAAADRDKNLTALSQDAGFTATKSKITNLPMFSNSGGYCTNYEIGLKKAMDEMEENARPNANKTIVFMTDGYPNLPGTATASTVTTCVNKYNNGVTKQNDADDAAADATYYTQQAAQHKAKRDTYTYNSTNWKTYNTKMNTALSNATTATNNKNTYQGQANTYFAQAKTCTEDYISNMETKTMAQVQRALDNDVKIHVIRISTEESSTLDTFRQLLDDEDYDLPLAEQIAEEGDGEYYWAENYNGDAIEEIYQQVAEDVHMRLAL